MPVGKMHRVRKLEHLAQEVRDRISGSAIFASLQANPHYRRFI